MMRRMSPEVETQAVVAQPVVGPVVARDSLPGLFVRFLRLGCMAWGGPLPQIAMLRHEAVETLGWLDGARFNRALAVYQALPGPEATEMAVYVGTVHRGRLGGLLAGLGFILPGLVLMLGLSWLYVRLGGLSPTSAAVLAGIQAAATALIVIATWRLGNAVLTRGWLVSLAVLGLAAQWAGVHFAITLLSAGLIYTLIRGHWTVTAGVVTGVLIAGIGIAAAGVFDGPDRTAAVAGGHAATLGELAITGLRAGLLTFGGAYTALPILERDAVGHWMTLEQLLDGVALTALIPAPLVTVGAFVGFLGGGPTGALVLAGMIYLPAFAFTLLGHGVFERVVQHAAMRVFLDGVTAGLIGLMAAVPLAAVRAQLLVPGSGSLKPGATIIFFAALTALHLWRSRIATPVIILSAGVLGIVVWLVGL
jgi:chromate transporter